jgi:hypothetical protein
MFQFQLESISSTWSLFLGLLSYAVSQTVRRRMIGWQLTNELERIWKGSGREPVEVLSQHLPGESEGSSVRIAGVPTEIRSW